MAIPDSKSSSLPRSGTSALALTLPSAANASIPESLASVTTVLGALPDVMAPRDELLTHLPTFDISLLDKFEAYALALVHAHAQHLGAEVPEEDTAALAEAVGNMRELLLSDWRALAHRGLVSGAKLQELKGANGYRNSTGDVLTMTGIIRNHWAHCEGKTALTLAELDQAESLAYRLLSSLGHREQGPVEVADAARTRQQAYSLFVRAHDQIRRGLCYLRWDIGDWEEVLPSLYAGRGRRTLSDRVPSPGDGAPGAGSDDGNPFAPAANGGAGAAGTGTAQPGAGLGGASSTGPSAGGPTVSASGNAATAQAAATSAGTQVAGVATGTGAATRSDLPGGSPFVIQ